MNSDIKKERRRFEDRLRKDCAMLMERGAEPLMVLEAIEETHRKWVEELEALLYELAHRA